ncbi:hypothetical protein A2961_01830 [Candidatus Woesebacteria bacterium RIFCSPLOWO2_01_FULL_39_21]|uniref:Large ribosomal subunit protein bL25 n=1 Tax=Candidatus Woesebacteria bacterium RIFCSPLOWO2_01_FULL_39_21 TaxID=1802519 RepID=A0A1F8BHF8_9BACT|nr:MAG: hypothetical protein A2691_01665 [Candidatus Woesebacteria bacterium RIFCSPHIGHO2_01_FULL_39_23]OGM63496.1 MAG: hypothetical protein A2961_01830 [Candidatus Woesebacteria bacterium RIFCSPLOWO2_01_FULL_39_21]
MDKVVLKSQDRKVTGRKVKNLRKVGLLPGVIYGKDIKSIPVAVEFREFEKVYEKAGETSIVELVLGSSKKPVLIHNVQRNPVTDQPVHADFLQVNLKVEVNATVPIEVIGESPAQKSGLGTIVLQLGEIEVRALPLNLPDKFIVDVSLLEEVDQAILVKDLKYERTKVEVKTEPNQIVVKVEPPQKEEVVEVPKAEVEAKAEEAQPQEGEAKEAEEKLDSEPPENPLKKE